MCMYVCAHPCMHACVYQSCLSESTHLSAKKKNPHTVEHSALRIKRTVVWRWGHRSHLIELIWREITPFGRDQIPQRTISYRGYHEVTSFTKSVTIRRQRSARAQFNWQTTDCSAPTVKFQADNLRHPWCHHRHRYMVTWSAHAALRKILAQIYRKTKTHQKENTLRVCYLVLLMKLT